MNEKIAVIIPDRGDRPDFLEMCKHMLRTQTVQPDEIIFVDFPAVDDKCDITLRYRTAYHRLDGMNFDCILFIENDDYYAPNYIETMVRKWNEHGKPDLFGTGYTYYYHIGLAKFVKFDHKRRASMMNTLIKPDMQFEWCADDYPYTDAWLWQKIPNRVTFIPEKPIALGIKHGIGMSGGEFHRTRLERYRDHDSGFKFLRSNTTNEMFNFYISIYGQISSQFKDQR